MIGPKTEKWIKKMLPSAKEIVDVNQLIGGISALVYRVILLEHEREQSYILRSVQNQEWLQLEPDLILHEKAVLSYLDKHQQFLLSRKLFSTPQCIATDATGLEADHPSLLMTELSGVVLLPQKPSLKWINQLAAAIAEIHELPVVNKELAYHYAPYHQLNKYPSQLWSTRSEDWELCKQYLLEHKPDDKLCLIHRDYHPTNVLWDEENTIVTGIVDWVNGCLGPAGVDVGHCRINLVQLYGLEAANQFLEAYCLKRPDFQYDPYWDICSLFDVTLNGQVQVYSGWIELGFSGLTDMLIQGRIDQYLAQIVHLINHKRYNKII